MYNKLIYGKNDITNIVSVEADEDKLIVFTEKNGEINSNFLPATYWFITNKRISQKQKELENAQTKHSDEIEKHAGRIDLLNKSLEDAQALHEDSLAKINDIKARADKLGIDLQPVEKVQIGRAHV